MDNTNVLYKEAQKSIKTISILTTIGAIASWIVSYGTSFLFILSGISIATIYFLRGEEFDNKDPLYDEIMADIVNGYPTAKRPIKKKYHIGDARWKAIMERATDEGVLRKVKINGSNKNAAYLLETRRT